MILRYFYNSMSRFCRQRLRSNRLFWSNRHFGRAGYVCSNDHVVLRLYKTGGVLLGYLSHLLLDELYSVGVRRGRLRVKRSLGSALKMWGKSPWANISTYGKLILLIGLVFGDPVFMKHFNLQDGSAARTARRLVDDVLERGDRILR